MVASHDATAASHHDVDLRVEGERETPFRRQPRINAAPEPSEYPALLDSSQWTRSATLPQNDHFTTPSQRIGRHYRQRLDEQNVEQLAHRRSERTAPISPLRPTIDRKGYAVGLACRPLLQPIGQEEEYPESTSMLGVIGRQCEADEEARQAVFQGTHREAHLSNADVLRQRLDNYVLAGVDESTLAPFNDEWADNAMEQVPSRLTGVPQEKVAGMVDEMLSEVQDDYYTAVKTSMVRYVLKNPAEARRVEIAAPPRPFELSTFHPSQDASVAACAAPLSHDSMSLGAWHQNVLSGFEGIDRTLAVNHDGMLQMLDLWGLYSHLLLCNVAPLPPTSPMELDAFKDLQHSHCEKVVQALKKKWFPAVLEIFRREMQQEDEGNNGGGPEGSPLLAAVSTLMSNQLRGLLTASIQALVSFMERYEQTNEEEADLHSELVHDIPADRPPRLRPLFVVKMLVEGDAFKFAPSQGGLIKAVQGVVDQFVAMMNTIPRIESELGKGTAGGARLLTVASVEEEMVMLAKQRLQALVEKNFALTAQMSAAYAPFVYVLSADTDKKVDDFVKEKKPLAEASTEIAKFDRAVKEIDKRSLPEVRFNMCAIACQAVKTRLSARAEELAQRMRTAIGSAFVDGNTEICSRYQEMFVRLGHRPSTEEEMVELENYLGTCPDLMSKLNTELNEARKVLKFLVEQRFPLGPDELRLVGDTWAWPHKIKPKVEECDKRLKAERNRAEDELNDKVAKFIEELDDYVRQAEAFSAHGELERMAENTAALQTLSSKIKEAKERAEGLNGEEELLGFPRSTFPQLEEAPSILAPYLQLWNVAQDFQKKTYAWLNGPMQGLDPEALEREIKDMSKANFKSMKFFENSETELPAPLRVAEQLKEQMDEFQTKLPLISCLCNPGMRERHWAEVSKLLGYPFKPTDSTTLASMLTMGLEQHLPALDEIGGGASKEYSLEKALDKMLADWQPLELTMVEYRDTGTSIVGGTEEIQMLLDDHVVKSQTMQGSPFIKPFAERAKAWGDKLVLIQDLVDLWLKVQGVWQYLEPIFGSEDIMRQMPKEGALFKKQDGMWRDNVNKVKVDVRVLVVADIPGILESYQEQQETLELVQKGLNDYLEMKRLYFPRFFFLSNDEMLEILSETKDPTRVQPHLCKCFEGIGNLVFEENNLITGMVSGEGETVPFGGENIQPSSMVEQWLVEVEERMFKSMARVVRESNAAHKQTDRISWMQQWQGQVVICVAGIAWTHDVESVLASSGSAGLAEYGNTCASDLNNTVELVRGELPKLVRKVVAPLIVIDVHARDVVIEMAKKGISNPNDFDWLAQLRYYPIAEENNDIKIRMLSTELPYGYEYLGLQGRLVVTPLTDRCYRTLMGALQLDLGGAPEGPAGTGKTETTKDLGKAVARQCIVMNCSDGLDFLAMAKFFKGLAAAGAWGCFDEFNRIDIEVLSVVAQQILTIIRAKTARLETFEFEGSTLPLKRMCNSFITMNPGYAGRAELPDNLKALFRTVAMMVPDYALIGEVMLLSSGYMEARPLARKIVQTYKLCSEQLSSQDHYDYGMRAVMSVLRAAANLKREFIEADESHLMLRSIIDVNLPKFLSPDVPLFDGITSDLFPGIELPPADYDHLHRACQAYCDKENLQLTATFFVKISQLYEMIIVRHGLMLVGYSFGAKTSAYRTLGAALGQMKEEGHDGPITQPCHYHVMNPKSITMGQLYGQFDPVTHEWSDGILAVLYRNAANEQKMKKVDDRQWVLFDGPVDAIWIENMNTVLDDNKKLCLMSGEMIAMSAAMSMIFEVQDLAVASPATVSRCGMVYVEPSDLGWEPLLTSWIKTLPACLAPHHDKLRNLFGWLVPPCLRFVRKECKSMLMVGIPETDEITKAKALMMLLEALWVCLAEDEEKGAAVAKQLPLWVENLFLFALVWSVAGLIDGPSRPKFDAFFRQICTAKPPRGYEKVDGAFGEQAVFEKFFPEDATVFEYTFSLTKHNWSTWMDTITKEDQVIEASADFSSIIVPTLDTARYTSLLNTLLSHNVPLLYVGPTGTGKTAYVQKHVLALPADGWSSIFLNFSAQTSANQSQDIVDAKLDKRRKGVFGPPMGKRCVIFVDDLNMPALETYGAQPPIEILRQFMDHKGWYDRKENVFRNLVDLSWVAAMGPPGGGRNQITPRYMRHFNIIAYTPFDDASMQRIFQTILDWWLRKEGFEPAYTKLSAPIIAATMDIYKGSIISLLPTPSKSHYTFNLRDFARVVQGVLLSDKADFEQSGDLILLWSHELFRVFYDRLIDSEDRQWFLDETKQLCTKHFDQPLPGLFQKCGIRCEDDVGEDDVRYLIFSSFSDPKASKKTYKRVPDPVELQKTMAGYLDDYNQISSKPMKLVLFLFCVEHVCRITRVLQMPRGNALLAGVGGSGRQSVTRLAAHLAEYEVFSIEVSKSYSRADWREDIKKVLRMAGEQGKATVFLFADTQVKDEAYVEDINGLLNAGEVPNLFPNDEKAQICDGVRGSARDDGKEGDGSTTTMFAYFVNRCRELLHVCLAFSPIGDAFSRRLRMFPALVNCCTIDWFTAWPPDALDAVASTFLEEVEMEKHNRQSTVEMCKIFHETVRELSLKFSSSEKRQVYVTPTAYLELIQTYQTLLARKRKEVGGLRARYDNGLQQLNTAGEAVVLMQEELTALKPELIKAKAEAEEMQVNIDKEVSEVIEPKKAIVEKEEAEVGLVAARAKGMKEECEADLAEAIPALEAAVAALDTLKKADIDLVKTMGNPPSGVKLTLEAVCVMKDIKPEKVKDKDSGKMVEDYFGPGKKMLMDANAFVKGLKEYDKDNIPPKIIKRIREHYVPMEDFEPDKIAKASTACEGMCKWVRAIEIYDRVAKVVGPKKEALAIAEGEYAEAMKGLAVKQAELKVVMDKLEAMQAKLKELSETVAGLNAKYEDCNNKLERAEKLMAGLGGEKVRWGEISVELGPKYLNLLGDVLVSAGVIAYLGPFTIPYRKLALEQWKVGLAEKRIPKSDKFNFQEVVGDPVKIRAWNLQGLPTDSFSIDNGIITAAARRWPLMIDPQGQANKWVRKMEAEAGLLVIKLTQSDYLRTLENAIQFGKPVLCENVLEQLDPALEPLLVKQTFKQGGVECIRLGDATIEYSADFKFYITSKLRNPHYLPELQVKVTLLNFMITPDGLEDQLLGIVVAKERPDLEEEKSRLVQEGASNKKKLSEVEDQILEVLETAGGSILEDASAIEILDGAKKLSDEISAKQKIADETEIKIDEARAAYKPVSYRSAVLFFCIASLAAIDPMYQYSLDWFIDLFCRAIADSEPSDELQVRMENLNSYFQYFLYKNVCRSLFERDKLTFSLLLCTDLMRGYDKLDHAEWRYLLTGGMMLDASGLAKNPAPEWVTQKVWEDINTLSDIEALKGFNERFAKEPQAYAPFVSSPAPYECWDKLPEWTQALTPFQRLLLLRVLRQDKLVPAISQFVSAEIGQKFIEPPPFDLEGSFNDSTSTSPLVFILSPGVDPMLSLLKFAEAKGRQVDAISLGQGQGPHAEKMLSNGQEKGNWVCLQNCHLFVSWMVTLEKLVEEMDPKVVHKNFRLWLTSYPSPAFPVLILQNGVKMTNEPPKGLRANMLQSYLADPISDPDFFSKCQKQDVWRRMLFALCFLHAWLQERRKYGPLGWNISYEFNESDLRISVRQLQMMIDMYDEVPFEALNYLTAECNYGGRVTDDKDRRTLTTVVLQFYNPTILGDGCALTASGKYCVPVDELASPEDTMDYIRKWPLVPEPEVFGLNDNADITKDLGEVDLMLSTVLVTQSSSGGGGGGGQSKDELISDMCKDILSKLPPNFDMELAAKRYPVMYTECLNTVVRQELQRFNKLLSKMRTSLLDLQKAVRGLVVMSADLDGVMQAMFDNQLPALWAKVSYPSLKPLASYVTDLGDKLDFFQDWVDHGAPAVFIMPFFFFVQAFMTGALQNYARKHTLPIDSVDFAFEFQADIPTTAPENGVYTHGLFVEGARMDEDTLQLAESKPKVLFSPMCIVKLLPTVIAEIPEYPHYLCPVYRTTARKGTLSTTGHSTNFVMFLRLPSDQQPSHWITRGVALISTLSD